MDKKYLERKIDECRRSFLPKEVGFYYSFLPLADNSPMELKTYFDGSWTLKEFVVWINEKYSESPFMRYSFVHELGHAREIVETLSAGAEIRARKTLWDNITGEIRADRYVIREIQKGDPNLNKNAMRTWLWKKILLNFRIFFREKENKKANFENLVLNSARFIAFLSA
jgi:hypothetical protein